MKKPVNLFYPIKVWLFSIIAAPAIFSIWMYLESEYGSNEAGPIKIYGIIFWFGFLYSIPSVIISYLWYRYLLFRNFKYIKIKAALIIIGFILFTITLAVLGFAINLGEPAKWTLPILYLFFFLLGFVFFKIGKKTYSTSSQYE